MELSKNQMSQEHGMQVKSILNRVENIPGFVFERVQWSEDGTRIEAEIRPRKGSRAKCSGCGEEGPGYDKLKKRRYQFVPLWQIPVMFAYRPRRVACRRCGVQVEKLPWAEGKNRVTTTMQWFLAMWSRRLSWDEVARIFQSSWQTVSRAVEQAVQWGRERVDLSDVHAIGVDELLHRRGTRAYTGPRFLTLVYQVDEHRKRLLWIGKDRQEQTLHRFFDWAGEQTTQQLKFICSDMWPPYLKAIRIRASQAIHMLDRFHVMSMINKALDRVRASEARELRAKNQGEVLTNSRWLFLKRKENLTERQHEKLAVILKQNLRIVRAYLFRESLQRFWRYVSPYAAGRFLDDWCNTAMRSRIAPMKKIAKSLRKHRELLLNYFRSRKVSMGAVEGLNNKAKVVTRKSYGFRSYKTIELALYHALGDLPVPDFAHKFW
jgi:transposase